MSGDDKSGSMMKSNIILKYVTSNVICFTLKLKLKLSSNKPYF